MRARFDAPCPACGAGPGEECFWAAYGTTLGRHHMHKERRVRAVLDASDGMIHIRRDPDDAPAKPVECGKTGQASVTDAWGFYGPTGKGYERICKECVAARKLRRGF